MIAYEQSMFDIGEANGLTQCLTRVRLDSRFRRRRAESRQSCNIFTSVFSIVVKVKVHDMCDSLRINCGGRNYFRKKTRCDLIGRVGSSGRQKLPEKIVAIITAGPEAAQSLGNTIE
jgi:hypothetical protein